MKDPFRFVLGEPCVERSDFLVKLCDFARHGDQLFLVALARTLQLGQPRFVLL